MLGYSKSGLEGKTFAELTHPDDRESSIRQFRADWGRVSGGSEIEKRYIARDGSVIWALVTVSSVVEPESGDTFHVTQIQNITKRKRAEAQLGEERQLIRAFLQTTADLVYFKDLESRFIRISNSQAARFGFAAPEDAIGKTDFDVFSDEHAREAFEDEQEIIRTGRPIVNAEERETYPNGGEAFVATTKMPLRDERGTVIGTFGISRDISSRKKAEQSLQSAEQRWRALLANCQELVMLVDSDGVFVYASPSVQRWLGYSPDELLGTPLAALCHEQDADPFAAAFRRVRDQSSEVKEPVRSATVSDTRTADGVRWNRRSCLSRTIRRSRRCWSTRAMSPSGWRSSRSASGSNCSGACHSGSRRWVSWRPGSRTRSTPRCSTSEIRSRSCEMRPTGSWP